MTHRLLSGAVLVALFGVAFSGASTSAQRPEAAPTAGGASGHEERQAPLVGITWGANITAAMQGGELVRVDPRSFRPLSGPRIELGFHGYSWSYSPDRSQLAIGGFASGIRFVDLERFEAVGDLRENRRGGLVVGVAWPKPNRVLAVVQEPWAAGELTLAVVDPVERRVLEWRPLSLSAGAVHAVARRTGLVLLLAPLRKPRRETVGPARLLFITARGRARSLVLERVLMGQEPVARGSSGIVLRWWQPGLALDSAGRRAFIVAGGAPVAEVDLRSMRVTYHELREPISLLGRLHSWLEPEAQAKGEFEGPTRTVRWLGDGQLAVSGFDGQAGKPTKASGLKVIDTRTWAVRTIENEAADFVSTQRVLVGLCCNYPTGGDALGLAAYDPNGKRLWHLFRGRPIPAVEAAGGRAYALIPTRGGRSAAALGRCRRRTQGQAAAQGADALDAPPAAVGASMGGVSSRFLIARALALVLLALLPASSASAQPSRPGALILDARSGRILASVPINDLITSAVPDGRGGWYVSGFFTRIGGQPRRGLAHLLPNGSVDPRFKVPVASSRGNPVSVRALTRAGELLYLGCACGLVGGLHRPGLAAIDLRTRAVLDSFEPGTWTDIDRLAVTGERLLVARSCCTYPVPGIAALDLRTGALDRSWDARFRLIPDAGVFNALVVRGSGVFAAGTFRVSGLSRNGLVALDALTGAPDPLWAPKPPDCPVCRGFATLSGLAVSDEHVYVSGFFSRFGGVLRNGVVALDPRTGAVDRGWRPARGSQGILTIALAGGRLYLGTMNGLVALDAETGAAVRAPKVPFGEVFPLVPSGRRLLVAGR